MTDFIVSSILDLLMETIVDKAKDEVKLLVGVEDEVKKLQRTLNSIRLLLGDAEEKKFKPENKPLKEWLDSLKEACFDMEDALDEWRIAVEMDGDTTEMARDTLWKKVCRFISCFSSIPQQLGSRRGIALNIKEISGRLDEIAKDRDRYQLEKREIKPHSTWRETASIVEESKILGREVEKDIVLSRLLRRESSDEAIKTISLVGMGGLGKTALAQIVYNDRAVVEQFGDARIWVCVSDVFDEKKVAKTIIEGLEKVSGAAAQGLETDSWDVLLQRISKSLGKRKFFLVLDDVWGDRRGKWEDLLACFKQYSAAGSRILVTTRKAEVETMMGSLLPSQIIRLKELGDEMCWSIIEQRALGGRHCNDRLEGIGRKIATKCKGLPLAAKTLGSLLRSKEGITEWESVLNSEMWNLDQLVEEDVFAPLLLSYYDLPLEVRRCFLFCVSYPKDWNISVSELINAWMSLDYLGFGNYTDLELKGREYFNLLANRSFFQDLRRRNELEERETIDGTKIVYCNMHDLVHDFAKYLVENEFVYERKQPTDDHPRSIKLEKCRHLRMWFRESSSSFPAGSISGAKSLRSLGIYSDEDQHAVVEGLSSLLRQSKVLRLIELWLPPLVCLDHVGNLNHLRQLRLCSKSLRQLPEALSNLHQLIILDLKLCGDLEELPGWIGKLKNLRSLDTRGCWSLKKYPKEMGQLTLLECLLGAVVRVDCCNDEGEEFNLADVGKLRQLRTLSLDKVKGEEVNVEAAAQLSNLRELWVHSRACNESSVLDLESFLETMKLHLPSTTINFCDFRFLL